MGRPDRRKVGSIFVEIGDEHSETAMAEVLSVDYDEAGLYGREFDDVSDEEAPAAVAARACKEHVSVATRVFFRELGPPPTPSAPTPPGAVEERLVEAERDVDGERKRVVDYGVWLESQEYEDDLKFINADFVEFEVGATKLLMEQERGLGKGGHVWDGAYVLTEALLVMPPKNLQKEGATVLELGAGAGLTGIAVALHNPSARVTITDGDGGVVDLLERNLRRNRCAASTKRLTWTQDDGETRNGQSEESWRPAAPGGDEPPTPPVKFDVILAAEAVAPIYDAAALVATLKRHAHATTQIRMVCKDGKWPDHAKFFYELLAADFAYTVEKPTSKLKASYFSLVSAALKKKPPPDPFSDEACTSVAAATAEPPADAPAPAADPETSTPAP